MHNQFLIVHYFIFEEEIENMFDFDAIETHINSFLEKEIGVSTKVGTGLNQWGNEDVEILCGNVDLVVYVTGLTAVTATLIKCCALNGVKLTLMHFDRCSNEYVSQIIFQVY